MHGTAMASKRKRMGQQPLTSRMLTAGDRSPVDVDERGITPERENQAEGFIEVGRDERNRPTVRTMRDSPLERLLFRRVITKIQYDAGAKYRFHWYHGGLSAPQSIDLNRIFAADPGAFSGMARSEAQAFHRQQYRGAVLQIGMISAALLDNVVCAELTLEQAGYKLGWPNKPQAVAAATERVKGALDELVKLWGMG